MSDLARKVRQLADEAWEEGQTFLSGDLHDAARRQSAREIDFAKVIPISPKVESSPLPSAS